MRFYRLIDNQKDIEIQTLLDKAQKIADGDVEEVNANSTNPCTKQTPPFTFLQSENPHGAMPAPT